MENMVKFETPWTERITNWTKFKPFRVWYHRNKSNLWRLGGNNRFRIRMFLLQNIPPEYKSLLGKNIRDPQKVTRNSVITAIYVPLGHEESAKVAIKRLGYSKLKKQRTMLWNARI